MRYGAGAGRVAPRVGQHDDPPPPRGAARGLQGRRDCLLFGSGYLANVGVVSALAQEGDVVFSDALNHASIVDGCRLGRAETFVYDHADVDHLEWGLRQAEGRGSLIVTDGVFSMDGDVAPLERIVELAQRYDARVMVDEAHGTGAVGPDGRGAVAAAGARGRGGRDRRARSARRSAPTAPTSAASDSLAKYLVNTARTLIFSTALPPARRGRRRWPRSSCCASSRAGWRSSSATPPCCARRWPSTGLPLGDSEHADRAADRRRRRRHGERPASARSSAGVFAQAIRPPTVPGRHVAAAADRDGLPHQVGAARGRRRRWPPRSPGARAPRREPAPPGARGVRRAPRRRLATVTPLRGLFVTGTDTGVGKTVVAAAICAALAERGERVAAFKPVVTGLDEPPGDWPPDHELLAEAANAGQAPGAGGALPVRPAAVAALRGGAGRRDDRAGRRWSRPRARRPRPDCWSARASAACWCRSRPATSCATSRWTSACRWWSRPAPASARSTTRCSRWRPRAPPACTVAGVVMTPWPARPDADRGLEPRDGRAARRACR